MNDVFALVDKTALCNSDLYWCYVTKDKVPIKADGSLVKPNLMSDFCSYEELPRMCYDKKAVGLGVSIQASNLCAIDIDKCFSIPFDKNSGDSRATDIIEMFKDKAYIEFSFSGTGLRILFRCGSIEGYSNEYYIKNESNKIEYYQPNKSFRYVTITGRTIIDKEIDYDESIIDTLMIFLEKYMRKPHKKIIRTIEVFEDTRSIESLMLEVKFHYFKNIRFQNLWFGVAPGSGHDESERDFKIITYLFDNITPDKDKIRLLFETSPYYKSKDWKHIKKWEYNNYRYFNYIYEQIWRSNSYGY